MPYIEQKKRAEVDEQIDELIGSLTHFGTNESADDGVVNYAITRLMNAVYCRKGFIRYSSLNKAIGVLECVKLELARRVAAPYEDEKMKENGDVYV